MVLQYTTGSSCQCLKIHPSSASPQPINSCSVTAVEHGPDGGVSSFSHAVNPAISFQLKYGQPFFGQSSICQVSVGWLSMPPELLWLVIKRGGLCPLVNVGNVEKCFWSGVATISCFSHEGESLPPIWKSNVVWEPVMPVLPYPWLPSQPSVCTPGYHIYCVMSSAHQWQYHSLFNLVHP